MARLRRLLIFRLLTAAAICGAILGAIRGVLALRDHGIMQEAARVREFRSLTAGCRVVERGHADPAPNGVHSSILYGCPDGRRERFPAYRAKESEAAP
jgi:hypothetical protein